MDQIRARYDEILKPVHERPVDSSTNRPSSFYEVSEAERYELWDQLYDDLDSVFGSEISGRSSQMSKPC